MICWKNKINIRMFVVGCKVINHLVGFILSQICLNSAFRNPVFRWESCKGSVWESVKKKLKSVHSAGPLDWILRLAVGKLPKEAHVWSMQKSWSVALTRALQDKTSSLTKQLAHDLDSRLSQVARLSCQTTLFGKNWPFAFQTHTSKIPLIPTYCRELSKRILREKP